MDSNYDLDIFVIQDYKVYNYEYKGCSVSLKHCNSATTDFDLTGQIIWPASLALSHYIIDNQPLFSNTTVLELGAGAGLSGLVCAEFAKKVYLTDGNDIVMRLLHLNAQESKHKDRLLSYKFDWSEYETFYRDTPGADEIEWLIGADILFWPQSMRPLCDTINYFADKRKAKGCELRIVAALKRRAGSVQKQFDQILSEKKLQRVQVAEHFDVPVYIISQI